MSKFLAVISCFIISVLVTCATMIKGWGLEAKSWPWIIGLGVIGQTIWTFILSKVIKEITEIK